jgi:hypothetical protein
MDPGSFKMFTIPLQRNPPSAAKSANSFSCAAALLWWIGVTSAAAGADTPANTAATTPIELRELPLLLVDDGPIASSEGLVRTVHPAKTRSAPVIEPTEAWEGQRVYNYGSVEWDPAQRIFRMWYMSRSEGTPIVAPTLRGGGRDLVLVANSQDGVTWRKDPVNIHSYNGSTANNIVSDLHTPSVLHDRFERDPAKAYKLLGHSRGGYYAQYSPDGVHWTAYSNEPAFPGDDTMRLTQNPSTGEYMAYFKKGDPAHPGRIVWLTRSRDFVTWTPPQLVFHTDAEDNSWATQPDQRTDVYNMAVFPHAGGFIGLPTIFRIIAQAPKSAKMGSGQSPHSGPIDVQLVTSTDGATWRRSWPRLAVIPRGAPGTFDGGAILGVSSNKIDFGAETWVYYTAINTGHGGTMPPKRLTIGRAEWRLNGFVSLDADPVGGRFETVPVRLTRPNLVLNANAQRGVVRVGLVEIDGRPIRGFDVSECEPLRTDATHWAVSWKSGGTPPVDRPVRVIVQLQSAQVFSLGVDADGSPAR